MLAAEARGHAAALFTVLVWGTTFVSTKVLLTDFSPIEILFLRFALGFAALWLVCPRRMGKTPARQELTFAAAGLCGVCLYYLTENVALTLTLASNVGVIISIAPLFTALLAWAFYRRGARPSGWFFVGFVVAMIGVGLVSFAGSDAALNPAGDALALMAALLWACYSLLTRMIASFGFSTVQTTRKTFFYGLVWMVPALMVFGFDIEPTCFLNPVVVGNLLFLGLGASAACFVTWNYAVKSLGAVKTSAYIYLVPSITVAASVAVLGEPLTGLVVLGVALTVTGLIMSERVR